MEKKLDFDDVLIVPRSSTVDSRKDVSLVREFKFENGQCIYNVPIIAANMKNIGTIKVAEVLKEHLMLVALNRGCPSTLDLIHTAFDTYGVDETMSYSPYHPPLICLDVANGYMDKFVARVMQVRKDCPYAIIMAGNVVTGDGTKQLIDAGADIIKVGLGSGAACTTRMKTGVGYPQISAVMECSELAHRYDRYICSDGGHRTPGDIAKSYAAGADFVMLGAMLSGTRETGDELVGNSYRPFKRGEYRSSEGTVVNSFITAPFLTLEETIQDILGGLRSACSYVGAHNLEEFQQRAQLIRV